MRSDQGLETELLKVATRALRTVMKNGLFEKTLRKFCHSENMETVNTPQSLESW